jgi:hypothetical protein
MLDSIQNAWNSTKDFFTADSLEEEVARKRAIRRWSAHLTFLGSAVGGAGLGLALRDALENKGSENIVIGQLDSAATALGMSDSAIEGACVGAGVGGGVGLGKGLHSLIRPEERVEINLPYVDRNVDHKEAQRILRREQRETRLAMIDIAETVGVEDVSDLADGYAPIQSLTNAIMDELEDAEKHPRLWEIRSHALHESVARSIIANIQSLENGSPSLVKAIVEGENRQEVLEAAQETIDVLEDSDEDESESEQSAAAENSEADESAASNGEANEPAEAAQA